MYQGFVELIPAQQTPRVGSHAIRGISYPDLGPRKLSGKPASAGENTDQPWSNCQQNGDMNMSVLNEGEIELVLFNVIDAGGLDGFEEHPSGI